MPKCEVKRESMGPRASGNRIRMYAGPVSWVSNYDHCGCEVQIVNLQSESL